MLEEGGVDDVDEKGQRKQGDASTVSIIRGKKVRSAGEGVRSSK